ncbi:hypothetical protein SK128_024518 [Halocaridina rubra]|uniref:PiggyBac transposable element-derived protein 4 C-terminal zinc-ribbon domain-containing protein n=1 Tax=Halocaridina rubra TaxID=373956 RepID=A0AAN8WVK0_HALRR
MKRISIILPVTWVERNVLTVAAAALAAVVAAVENRNPQSYHSLHSLHHPSTRLPPYNSQNRHPAAHRHHHHHHHGLRHLAHKSSGNNSSPYAGVVATEMIMSVDGTQHCLIQEGYKRWRCKRCNVNGHEKRTKFKCHKCNVALCPPCFQHYHLGNEEQQLGLSYGQKME